MKKLLATAAVLLSLVPTANAQMSKRNGQGQRSNNIGITFEKWFNYCQEADTKRGNAKNNTPASVSASQFCYGLTLGVAEGTDFVIKDEKLNTICMPDATPTREMVEVGQAFYRNLKDKDLRQANFAAGLAYAFFAVWPCGQPS